MNKIILTAALCAMMLPVSLHAQEAPKPPVNTYKLSGFVMTRYNYTSKDNATPNNSLSIRLARMQVDGRVLGDFNYRLQVQVNGTSNAIGGPRIVDAYVEWQKYKQFYVKFGQFKRAFTFENPMNPIDQGFYGYSQSTDKLAGMNDRIGEHPSNGRDLGLQLQGDLFELDNHPLMHYQLGVYNGQGINVADVDNCKDLIGGLWFIPVQGMRIGAFGWLGTYARKGTDGVTSIDRNRYAFSGEYKTHDWTFRSEYVHSYGYAFNGAYGSGNTTLNTTLGNRADAWYALVIAPVVENVFHVKARYDVYRDRGAWGTAISKYDIGCDYQFTKNLVLSAIYSFVNDRHLADDAHNYSTADIQVSWRF